LDFDQISRVELLFPVQSSKRTPFLPFVVLCRAILTEPQLWYNLNNHIALGGELEISKNFLPYDDVKFMPTVAAKWTF
jgi:hypothetical protein